MIEMLRDNPKFLAGNIITSTDWAEVKSNEFSAIYAIIVLQHLHLDVLRMYLKDFTYMTNNLYIQSRSYSDYERLSMWELLSEFWEFDESFNGSSIDFVKTAKDNDHYFIRMNKK